MHFTEILQWYKFRKSKVLVGLLPTHGGASHGRRRAGRRSSAHSPRTRGEAPRVKGEGYGPREKSQTLETAHISFPPHSLRRTREWRKEVNNGGGGKRRGRNENCE